MFNTLRRYFSGLYQLSRPDPVASWAGGAFLIGIAFAYQNVGLDMAYLNGLLALIAVISAIAFGAHGINDAYDWITGTDKESIGKGTGGSRVIPDGKFTVYETALIGVLALIITFLIGMYLYFEYGWPLLVITGIAIAAPLAYSLPPVKLAYRPFSEILVVIPAVTSVTIVSEFVLSYTVTGFAILAGLIHSAFCISWYIVSRVPDYEPDRVVGKNTTVVFIGRAYAPLISGVYLLLGVGLSVFGIISYSWSFGVTVVFGGFLLLGLHQLDPFDPESASRIRYRQMRITTLHAALLAIVIGSF